MIFLAPMVFNLSLQRVTLCMQVLNNLNFISNGETCNYLFSVDYLMQHSKRYHQTTNANELGTLSRSSVGSLILICTNWVLQFITNIRGCFHGYQDTSMGTRINSIWVDAALQLEQTPSSSYSFCLSDNYCALPLI